MQKGGPTDHEKIKLARLNKFGQNMFAIGVLSQSVTVGPYFVHENLSLVGLGHINHFLNDIVGKLIFHHYVQCTGSPGKKERKHVK